MLTPILAFLIYIFLHQKRKQCLEFALPKPGEICKIAYNSNSHARGLHLSSFCTRETSREINAMGPVVLRKNVSEKLSIINPPQDIPLATAHVSISHAPVASESLLTWGVFKPRFSTIIFFLHKPLAATFQ